MLDPKELNISLSAEANTEHPNTKGTYIRGNDYDGYVKGHPYWVQTNVGDEGDVIYRVSGNKWKVAGKAWLGINYCYPSSCRLSSKADNDAIGPHDSRLKWQYWKKDSQEMVKSNHVYVEGTY